MKRNLHKFTLSSEEMFLLSKAVSEAESLLSAIHSVGVETGDSVTLELERETTEELRDCLTEQLAKTGFDKNYLLTKEGAILEGLIDKLYIARP
jgi:hypothetical protein